MLKCRAAEPYRSGYIYERFPGTWFRHETWNCPRCHQVLNAGPNYQPNYCDKCGQKINFIHVEYKEDMPILTHQDVRDRHERAIKIYVKEQKK